MKRWLRILREPEALFALFLLSILFFSTPYALGNAHLHRSESTTFLMVCWIALVILLYAISKQYPEDDSVDFPDDHEDNKAA